MSFDHERLDVYQRALEVLDLIDGIVDQMPPGRAHLKDQLDRAATSVVLNIAEGAGEFSAADKQRFYRMARRSATETAAILDVLRRRGHAPDALLHPARELLLRIVSMLVRMAKLAGPG
jgi:four helix bundle protein